ncbi:MAG TPA: serine hydrolase, partial [Verrucomicrobiota bacterium]|nr:serine hydrolase [Verrucomicrobiota bacterium]
MNCAAVDFPSSEWKRISPSEAEMDKKTLLQAMDYALKGEGSGCVIRFGKMVLSWGNLKERYDLKSTTKSIGITALGLAIKDGKLSLSDKAIERHPEFGILPEENKTTGWLPKITLFHLATQTAGFAKPGGYEKLLFEPGSKWHYSDGGPNWLAEIITIAYNRDVSDLLFERVFTPIGISRNDLIWRQNAYRPRLINDIPRREFGAGVSANVDAMARIGYLYLRGGKWKENQIIPKEFVEACGKTDSKVAGLPVYEPKTYNNASDHYGLLWWNNSDGSLKNVPRDAFWAWGLYDSLIVVIPSLDIVVARTGKSWARKEGSRHYDVLQPFFNPIVESVKQKNRSDTFPPYPHSPVIRRVEFDSLKKIIRMAKGSDNFPLTWADDDNLYTAYGDGNGFEPYIKEKLSLGFARLFGFPPHIYAENIRSKTGEVLGDGKNGKKASGLLMVDNRLYMLVRNAGNSQLAYSDDYARNWTWANWKFTEIFGFPTFLNFGKNYSDARDDYVYIYSLDSDSAYKTCDRIILARLKKNLVLNRNNYEFFSGFDANNNPLWSSNISRRAEVFSYPEHCYRFSVSYNVGLKRYLLSMVLLNKDSNQNGGFGIYDAP